MTATTPCSGPNPSVFYAYAILLSCNSIGLLKFYNRQRRYNTAMQVKSSNIV
jgi:hypothetical protein